MTKVLKINDRAFCFLRTPIFYTKQTIRFIYQKYQHLNIYLTAAIGIPLLPLLSCKTDLTEKHPIATQFAVSVESKTFDTGTIPSGESVLERFKVPEGFKRVTPQKGSFGYFLQRFPLKPDGTAVHLFDGRLKSSQQVHAAVMDIDVGKRDLQQCADAIIRLRAEYFWQSRQYADIRFDLTNGFRADYARWRRGERVAVQGNETSWYDAKAPAEDYSGFRKYLEFVFSYAGTLSLARESVPVKLEDIRIGDFFIKGGSPGHAVLVVDLAQSEATGEKIFLLAQSYMPAQDIHILKNFDRPNISPWFSNRIDQQLFTPEWTFDREQLKRFPQ